MKNNDLISHEYVDTFYMTDEQIERAKKINKETGATKGLKKFFLGCAIGAIGTPVLGLLALTTTSAIATYGAFIGTPIVGAVIAMSGFFKAKKGGDKIRDDISNGGKHR